MSQIKAVEIPSNHTLKVILLNEFNLKSVNTVLVQFECKVVPVFSFNFTFKEQQDSIAK